MRTLQSLEAEEARLRKRHTEQTKAEKWVEAQTTQRKLISVLNAIHRLKHPQQEAVAIASAILDAGEDPKKALRNRTQGLAYRPQKIDRAKEKGWNFYVGGPICISFDVVAYDLAEAVRRANAVFDRLMTQHIHLNDQHDTSVFLDHNIKPEQIELTDRNCFMWWELDSEEDPTMNPDWSPEFLRS